MASDKGDVVQLKTSEQTPRQVLEDQVGQERQGLLWVQVIQIFPGVLAVPVFLLVLWAQVIQPYPELLYRLSDPSPLESLVALKTPWLL